MEAGLEVFEHAAEEDADGDLARAARVAGPRAGEVSIDELARAAGISKGLLFHYFPSKRDFYVATVRAASEQLLEVATPDPSLPPLERLARGLDAYLAYVERHGTAYVWLMRSGIGGDKAVLEVVEETRARFAARILEGFPLGDPPPRLRLLLRGWVGFVEAASVEWVATREVTRAELRELLAQVLIGSFTALLGVGPGGPKPPPQRGTRRARAP